MINKTKIVEQVCEKLEKDLTDQVRFDVNKEIKKLRNLNIDDDQEIINKIIKKVLK